MPVFLVQAFATVQIEAESENHAREIIRKRMTKYNPKNISVNLSVNDGDIFGMITFYSNSKITEL